MKKLCLVSMILLFFLGLVTLACNLTPAPPTPTPPTPSPKPTPTPTPIPTPPPTPPPTRPLSITAPSDKAQVPYRPLLEGTVTDPSIKEVWVIILPMETSEYWVQPKVTISDGKWQVMVYIGREGSIDVGKQFAVMAIADPTNTLKEGDKLSFWPEAKVKSQLVTVTRMQ